MLARTRPPRTWWDPQHPRSPRSRRERHSGVRRRSRVRAAPPASGACADRRGGAGARGALLTARPAARQTSRAARRATRRCAVGGAGAWRRLGPRLEPALRGHHRRRRLCREHDGSSTAAGRPGRPSHATWTRHDRHYLGRGSRGDRRCSRPGSGRGRPGVKPDRWRHRSLAVFSAAATAALARATSARPCAAARRAAAARVRASAAA